MMGKVHDLIVITGKEHGKANDTAEKFVQPLGLEHRPMGQFMLCGIEKIERHAKGKAGCQHPPASHCQIMQGRKAGNQAEMAGHLQAAAQVGFGVKGFQLCRFDQFAGGKGFFHYQISSISAVRRLPPITIELYSLRPYS